jgi:hypothetical protein
MPDTSILSPVRYIPGGITIYRANSKDRIEPISTGANPQVGEAIINVIHKRVEKAFKLDQLHLVENDRMTAEEVRVRSEQGLRTMSPILGRIVHELLSPCIMRTFNIMFRKGLIDPMPEGLEQYKMNIKFVSQMARAQETIDGDNFLRAMQVATVAAGGDPQALSSVNKDAVLRFAFKTYGAPLELLYTEQEVANREAQAMQMQQEVANAQINQMNSAARKNNAQALTME